MPLWIIGILIFFIVIAVFLVIHIYTSPSDYSTVEKKILERKKLEIETKIVLVEQEYPGNIQLLTKYKQKLQAVENLLARLN